MVLQPDFLQLVRKGKTFTVSRWQPVISQGTVSADKTAFYTLRNAMETCLIVDGGNLARHAGVSAAISQKNSTGTSSHYWTDLSQWFSLPSSRRLLE